jgi:hypothetical protein
MWRWCCCRRRAPPVADVEFDDLPDALRVYVRSAASDEERLARARQMRGGVELAHV